MKNFFIKSSEDRRHYFYTLAAIAIMSVVPLMGATGIIILQTYHFIMEMIIILISSAILLITDNTWSISKNEWFKYLGICFGILCIFVVCHTIFYHGTDVIYMKNKHLGYVFDLYESTIRAIAINIFLWFSYKGLEAKKYFKIYTLIPLLLMVFVIIDKIPPIFIPHSNGFNVSGQVLVIIMCLANLLIVYFRRNSLKLDTTINVALSTISAMLAEIMVVLNIESYNISFILSHYFKVISVYLMYRLIVKKVLSQPMQYLNQSLVEKNADLASTIEQLNIQNERLVKIRKALSEREKSYKAIIENIPIAIVLRQEERIIFLNDSAVKLFKKKDGRSIGGKSIFSYVHPDYMETAKKNFEESNNGKVIVSSEGKLLNCENEAMDVETTTIPIIFNNKKTQLILIRDMTQIKLSEAMKVELQMAKENERLCTEFFANLYHEFRTPLNVIYTSCQLVDMYVSQNSTENIGKYNKLAKQNCFRISKLVNNIIDSTRISEGFYQISRSMVDFVSVVEDTVLSVAPYLEKNKVDIVFDTDVEEKFMMVDEEKIERIVLNLLSNAVKYRCDKDSSIVIRIEDGEKEVTLSVKDNGIGIPKEKQKTIFNRFIKVDRSLNRGGEGSGLGLYIVKSLVELHDGTIELISEESKGSEFIIKLPVITSEKPVDENKIIKTKTLSEKIHIEFSDVYDFDEE